MAVVKGYSCPAVCGIHPVLQELLSHVHVHTLNERICLCPSGRASGTGHRRPQGADGEAGEGGAGALGVWWYGLTGQPPAAGHSCRPPAPSVLFPVRRRPRHEHNRERPCVRTWPGEEYSTLATNSLMEISLQRYEHLKTWDHFCRTKRDFLLFRLLDVLQRRWQNQTHFTSNT